MAVDEPPRLVVVQGRAAESRNKPTNSTSMVSGSRLLGCVRRYLASQFQPLKCRLAGQRCQGGPACFESTGEDRAHGILLPPVIIDRVIVAECGMGHAL